MPSVRPATMEDCEYIAAHLREADRQELQAVSGGMDPRDAAIDSFRSSVLVKVMEHEGVPFALYGVAPDECSNCTDKGVSWMVGTDDLKKHSMWFLRNYKWMLDEMHEHFPTFGNFADERNTVHIRWLKWAGFQFGRRVPHGGTYFLEHWRTKECA